MVIRIRQVVSHPAARKKLEKTCHVSGIDLAHCITAIRIPAEANPDERRRELRKNYRTNHVYPDGRRLLIEIEEELKA